MKSRDPTCTMAQALQVAVKRCPVIQLSDLVSDKIKWPSRVIKLSRREIYLHNFIRPLCICKDDPENN
jgi:hypothetical protein